LGQKISEIDKWKQEVNSLYQNEQEEKINYKRYKDHYRMLLAKSSIFQIEMQLLKDVQNKVALIEWRDKVEEIIEKLQKNEKISLDQI
jgi:uncharacterized protein YfkK (UPF0435 family)